MLCYATLRYAMLPGAPADDRAGRHFEEPRRVLRHAAVAGAGAGCEFASAAAPIAQQRVTRDIQCWPSWWRLTQRGEDEVRQARRLHAQRNQVASDFFQFLHINQAWALLSLRGGT